MSLRAAGREPNGVSREEGLPVQQEEIQAATQPTMSNASRTGNNWGQVLNYDFRTALRPPRDQRKKLFIKDLTL